MRTILENNFRIPAGPSKRRVMRMPLATGPRSMAGNIRIPENLGIGSPCRSLGATIANAADHEIAKVKTK
jgi:hypothetical protein